MELPERFNEALQKFVDKCKKDKNVIGILLTGSFIHSKPDKNSDLDVYILTNKSDFRERGNTWINNIEIEYFINPIKQVEEYFKEEIDGSPHTAHMFVNSKKLYSKGHELDRLIKKARRALKIKRKAMGPTSRENAKYKIDDLRKDLEDVYLKKDHFSFNQIAIEILNESLCTFLKVNQWNLEKSKRLKNYLSLKDKKFADLYSLALLETSTKKRFKELNRLVRYTESILGGKRPKEWRLKGKCTYLKRE